MLIKASNITVIDNGYLLNFDVKKVLKNYLL